MNAPASRTGPEVSALSTSLTRVLGIDLPVLGAPMGGVSGGRLAAAVSAAGGLGLIGAGYGDAQWIHGAFDDAGGAPVGIGFITWYLERHPDQLWAALEHAPAAVVLSFGDAAPHVEAIRSAGARLLMQVQTLAEARRALALGADAIVAQGADGGGHGRSRGTFALVPAVADVAGDTPVVAAGGVADGRGLAAALMLGASGVLIGTRLYASEEALGNQDAKRALVAASGDDTVRTRVFDIVRGYDWPEGYTGRALENAFVRRWHGHEDALEQALPAERERYHEAAGQGDVTAAVVWAGEAVDTISRVEPAGAIVERMVSEALRSLHTGPGTADT